jgi:predicted transcriptional regulator
VEKTSIRLPLDITKKLQHEARKRSLMSGGTVTISEVIRDYIAEQICQDAGKARRENAALIALKEEIVELQEAYRQLAQDLRKLDAKFPDSVPELATRDQVDTLTIAVAEMISVIKGG